jgi:hypothetical protein
MHVHVEQDQIGGMLAQLVQRHLAARRVIHFVAMSRQRDAHDAPDLRIVIDDENPPAAHAVTSARGSDSRNSVLVPGVLATVSAPPCASAICRTMASPMPVPGTCRACAPR